MAQATSTCPRCGTPISTSSRAGLLMCSACGFIPGVTPKDEPLRRPVDDDLEPGTEVASVPRLSFEIMYRGELTDRARSLYANGVSAQARGDHEVALEQFERALEMHPDFTDAHMAIARLVTDPKLQREHLSAALAYDPGNAEALRLWMVLNGQLSAEGAARAASNAEPELRIADEAVRSTTKVLICPVCGGHLTADEETQRILCRFCGHEESQKTRREIRAQSVGMALIARKAEPVRWVVGSRLLHCKNCGAERTIPSTTLSMECPFCGSNQVIEQDALGTLVQPDGLLPFRLEERDAVQALKRALDTPMQKLSGFFDDNRVKSGTVDGLYVPFWLFDIMVNIRRTVKDKDQTLGNRSFKVMAQLPREEEYGDALFNYPVLALRELNRVPPSDALDYDFSAMRPYEPNLLAKYPASIYDVDFDAGSLKARGEASKMMRAKHRGLEMDNSKTVSVSAQVQSLTFSLVLLPLFIVMLRERDGDQRPALVNGQTGTVALGKAIKPSR